MFAKDPLLSFDIPSPTIAIEAYTHDVCLGFAKVRGLCYRPRTLVFEHALSPRQEASAIFFGS